MFRQPWQKLSSLLSPKDDIRLDSDEDFSTATDNSPSQDLTGMIKLQNLVSFLQASALYSLCDFTAVDGWEGK